MVRRADPRVGRACARATQGARRRPCRPFRANGDEAKTLGEIVFDDVVKGQRKHRFSVNKMDFDFNRKCDAYLIGQNKERALLVSVISPLSDDYDLYDKGKLILDSTADGGCVLVRLCVQRRLACSAGERPAGAKIRTP